MTIPFQWPLPKLPNNVTFTDSQWATYINALWGYHLASGNKGGVWRGYLNELAVTEQGTPAAGVTVDTGFAMIDGRGLWISASENLTIAANASGNPRIDRIVASYVSANYPDTCALKVVQGTPAASPAPPALVQGAAEWQIPLAQVAVANGFATILDADIADDREWGNIPDAVQMQVVNASGATLDTGTVVYLFAGGDPPQVTATSTQGQRTVLGVVAGRILNGATGYIITHGVAPVLCDELVAAGAELEASTTAGQAQLSVTGGVFARALQANTGAGTRCLAYINVPVNRQVMVTGTYTGDGAATKSITGLGFQPRLVHLHRHTDLSVVDIRKNDQMGTSAVSDSAFKTDHIISLDSAGGGGFTVGDGSGSSNQANVNLAVYSYEAFA